MKKAFFLLNTDAEERGEYALVCYSAPLIRHLTTCHRATVAALSICHDNGLSPLKACTFETVHFSCLFIQERTANHVHGEPVFEKMLNSNDPLRLKYRPPEKAHSEDDDPEYSGHDTLFISGDATGFWWEGYPVGEIVRRMTDVTAWSFLQRCLHCERTKENHVAGHCLFGSTTYESLYDLKD